MATSKKIREQPISPAVVATAELIRHIKLVDCIEQLENRIKSLEEKGMR
ncbi:MAG: hypothetical protein PHI12_12365 [Dehalococcoidales bacterium]|jgi:hypothetical protein|nr:hypothetical protein [Dehalococcoidales bacterium]